MMPPMPVIVETVGRFAVVWLYAVAGRNLTTGSSATKGQAFDNSLVSAEELALVASRIDKLWLCFSRVFSGNPASPEVLRLCLTSALDDILLWFFRETGWIFGRAFDRIGGAMQNASVDLALTPTAAIAAVTVSSLVSFYVGQLSAKWSKPGDDATISQIQLPDSQYITVFTEPVAFYDE
jgi:hypothetical protein